MKATITLENGQVYAGDVVLVDAPKAGVAPHAEISIPVGGAAGQLLADSVTVSVPDVPQARELVVSVAGGDTWYYITVKDPDGNVCDQTPSIVPGGVVPRPPANRIGPFANAGQVEVLISKAGTYIAEIELTKCSGTGQETVEAHVN